MNELTIPTPSTHAWSSKPPQQRAVAVLGTGASLPERVLDNEHFARMVETSDEWIVARTGIRERHVVTSEATSDLAAAAAARALAAAGLEAAELELILVATSTPDEPVPPVACRVQAALGAERAFGFDIGAACSGFIAALATGHRLVASGAYRNAVVIGADVMSSMTDYSDRETSVLFGDGAGAVVLGEPRGASVMLDHQLGLDGRGADLICTRAGGSRLPASAATVAQRQHFLRMQGREVFRFAVQKLPEVVAELLHRNGFGLDDLRLLVPHQANLRILEAGAQRLGLPMERIAVNVDRFGNTAAASIPMALDEAARSGRIGPGDLVALVAFGGGLTWGGSLLRW